MKRTICIIIAAMLMLSSCSMIGNIGKKSEDSSFIEVANLLIESGDYDGALKVLEEGAEKTDSSVIKAMIYDVSQQIKDSSVVDKTDDLTSNDAEADSDVNVNLEVGKENNPAEEVSQESVSQATANYVPGVGVWTDGSAELVITENDFTYHDFSSNSTKVSEVYDTYPISSIVNNIAVVSYTDSWNNTGSHTFVFSDDCITVTSSVTQYDTYALWYYGDVTRTLYKKADDVVADNAASYDVTSGAIPFDIVNFDGQAMCNGYSLINYESDYIGTTLYPSNDYSTLAAAPVTIIGFDFLQSGTIVYFCEYPASPDYTIQLFGEESPEVILENGTQIIPYMVYTGQSWNYMGNCFDFDLISYTVV